MHLQNEAKYFTIEVFCVNWGFIIILYHGLKNFRSRGRDRDFTQAQGRPNTPLQLLTLLSCQ